MTGIKLSRGLRYPLAALLALTLGLVWTSFAMADAGNPILNTMKGTVLPANAGPNDPVTVYVRGQWDWLSHGGDCNQFAAASPGFTQANRAGTGVALIWNDPNGGTAAANEVQRISTTATGNFTLKWKDPSGTNRVTGTLTNGSTATQVDAALEAGFGTPPNSNDFTVTGSGTTASPWTITFVGDYAGRNVNPIQRNNGIALAFSSTDGNAQVFNGYPLSGTTPTGQDITVYIGTKTATSTTRGPNVVDGMIHPVDRGNRPENYDRGGNGLDYPGGQAFVDPTPVASGGDFTAAKAAWRAGCGRMPLSASAAPRTGSGANPESTGLRCGSGAVPGQPNNASDSGGDCAGEPWGSWGYEKNDGQALGYSHQYAHRSDLTSICANFYDQHGTAQVSSSSLDVLGNGDNSLGTNKFDLTQGANCLFFPQIVTTATDADVGGNISDSASLTGVPANAGGTLTFRAYKRALATDPPNCTGTANFTSSAIPVSGPGTYGSGDFDTSGATGGAGFYDWQVVYSGGGGIQGVTTVCGDASAGNDETSEVRKVRPTVTTNAGATKVLGFAAGSTVDLQDTATLSNGFNPTGTITFTLYGPNDATCSGTPVTGTPHNKTVNGNSPPDYMSNVITVSAPGTYRWKANYNGDSNNFETTNGCNGTDENVLVIRPEIDITKNPKSQSIPSGGMAHFTMVVTNTGDTRLNGIVVTDAEAPGCDRNATATAALAVAKYGAGHTFLDPTEFFTYECDSAARTAAFVNIVEVCGNVVLNPPGGTVCDTDTTGGGPPGCPEPDRCGSVTISDVTTTQDFVPRDNATISGLVGANPGGTLTFGLYTGSTCASNTQLDLNGGAAGKDLTAAVNNGNDTYGVVAAALLSAIIGNADTSGNYYWKVDYSGNAATNNAAIPGTCGEENFTIDNS